MKYQPTAIDVGPFSETSESHEVLKSGLPLDLTELRISMFQNAFGKEAEPVLFSKLIEAIHSGRWSGQIFKLRELIQAGDRETYNQTKKYLPAAYLSGLFHDRNKIIRHSGLLQIDLDKLKNPEEVREFLVEDQHIVTAFLSPSGEGVKAAIRIPPDPEKHLKSFMAAENYFLERHGLQIDKSRRDINGLCFVSHDPGIKINSSAIILDVNRWKPQLQGTQDKWILDGYDDSLKDEKNSLGIKWGSTDWKAVFESAELVLGPQGSRINVLCPWRDSHTTNRDGGSYLFQRQKDSWGWTCHHAHCQNRNLKDLAEKLKVHVLKYSEPFLNDPINSKKRINTEEGVFVVDNSDSEWEIPEKLPTEPSPPPDIPDQLFTHPFKEWVLDLSDRMSSPPEMVWVPLIVAFASAIGTQLAVRPKRDDFSWIMPPILWGCVVAPPGRKKSPATTPAIRLLQELEFQLREQMRPEILQSKTNLEFETARRKALKAKIEQSFKAGKESEARGFKVELDSLPEPEEPKTEPRLTTTDATPAMLIRLCRDNPEGLLVVADELMTVFRSCEKKGNEDLRQILLQGFDGDKPYYLDRKTEGLSDLAPQVALSLFGTAQPGVLQNEIRRAIESPDGLFARLCLAVYPRRRKFKQIDRLPDSKAEQLIRQLFSKTRPLNWKEIGALKSENDQFPFLGFDQETQSYFYEWQEELYNKRVADPDMPDYIKNHLAKHEKLICVLSLLFHVGEILSGRRKPGQITKESFVTSASWSQMLEIQQNGFIQRLDLVLLKELTHF